MSDIGETFKALEDFNKKKKQRNLEKSKEVLIENKIRFTELSDTHLRVGEYDFWPSTGLFIHVKTKKRNRGVFNLIKALKKDEK